MSTNTLIHRIVRPAVRRVAHTAITPNQITSVRLATGIAAAAAFAGGGNWMALGGAIFLLSMLLDRADGELARQTGQSSRFGHLYDLISDAFCNMIAILAIGIGLWSSHGGWAPLLGAIGGVGIGVLFWQINALHLATPRAHQLAPGIEADPDDAMVFVPLLVWLGLGFPMLVAAAVITPLAALWIAAKGRRSS